MGAEVQQYCQRAHTKHSKMKDNEHRNTPPDKKTMLTFPWLLRIIARSPLSCVVVMKIELAPPPGCCRLMLLYVARCRGVVVEAEVESVGKPLIVAVATPRAATCTALSLSPAKQGEQRGEIHLRSNKFDRARDIAWS